MKKYSLAIALLVLLGGSTTLPLATRKVTRKRNELTKLFDKKAPTQDDYTKAEKLYLELKGVKATSRAEKTRLDAMKANVVTPKKKIVPKAPKAPPVPAPGKAPKAAPPITPQALQKAKANLKKVQKQATDTDKVVKPFAKKVKEVRKRREDEKKKLLAKETAAKDAQRKLDQAVKNAAAKMEKVKELAKQIGKTKTEEEIKQITDKISVEFKRIQESQEQQDEQARLLAEASEAARKRGQEFDENVARLRKEQAEAEEHAAALELAVDSLPSIEDLPPLPGPPPPLVGELPPPPPPPVEDELPPLVPLEEVPGEIQVEAPLPPPVSGVVPSVPKAPPLPGTAEYKALVKQVAEQQAELKKSLGAASKELDVIEKARSEEEKNVARLAKDAAQAQKRVESQKKQQKDAMGDLFAAVKKRRSALREEEVEEESPPEEEREEELAPEKKRPVRPGPQMEWEKAFKSAAERMIPPRDPREEEIVEEDSSWEEE